MVEAGSGEQAGGGLVATIDHAQAPPEATALRERQPPRVHHDTERTLYVGNLHPFVNDTMLREVFETSGGVEDVKIVRCKVTSLSAGYGFVQFVDARHAERALANLHGRPLYNQELRLNWTFSRQQEDTTGHVQIFVGDLANDVNHRVLFDTFAARCANCSCVSATARYAVRSSSHTGMHVWCGTTTLDAPRAMALCRFALVRTQLRRLKL